VSVDIVGTSTEDDMKRRFVDAPDDQRCTATVILEDKSTAQCGRYQKVGCLCTQHAKIEADKKKAAA
jgi:hypothetical protein